MKLVEIILKHTTWPLDAHFAYQSAIDCEIYFLDKNAYGVVKSTKKNPVPICDCRGRKGLITYKEYTDHINPVILKKNRDEKAKSIQRIKQGLLDDFNIDSPALAEEMFNKGWRR